VAIYNLSGEFLILSPNPTDPTASVDMPTHGRVTIEYESRDVRKLALAEGTDDRLRVVAMTPAALVVQTDAALPDYGDVLIVPEVLYADALRCPLLRWGNVPPLVDPANVYLITCPAERGAITNGALRGEA
jgi:hypothetical protein